MFSIFNILSYPVNLLADSEGPDHTTWMRKLIWAFVFSTCLKTRFDMVRPIYNRHQGKHLSHKMRKRRPTFWYVRPTKTQISLHIRAVWSEASLYAWRIFASLAIQNAPGEDFWSACANAQADLNLHWSHKSEGIWPDDVAHSNCCIWGLNSRFMHSSSTEATNADWFKFYLRQNVE